MKVVSFFNEKGGVGKTTLTALFASFLAYKEKERVVVLDCDFPSYQLWGMQQLDVKALREGMSAGRIGLSLAQLCRGNNFYKVGKIEGRDVYGEAELSVISERIRRMRSSDSGYMLLDFPGRFLPNDPAARLSAEGLLDLVVFPVDSDRQSRSAALSTFARMKRQGTGRQRCAVLWNRETQVERRSKGDRYAEPEKAFESLGIPVIRTRIREILIARRDSNSQGFIRNTLCWPQQNIDRACPWIEDAFREIRLLIDADN